jgi:hypothetical protein
VERGGLGAARAGAAGLELTGGEALLAAATEMACELGHPAHDCFYVALAERLDFDWRGTPRGCATRPA